MSMGVCTSVLDSSQLLTGPCRYQCYSAETWWPDCPHLICAVTQLTGWPFGAAVSSHGFPESPGLSLELFGLK